MKKLIPAISILFLVSCASQPTTPKSAAKPGYKKAETCIACHDADGVSGKQGVPPVSHMSADELSATMTALKEAQLGFPLLAHSLSDQDVRDIAGYFASVNR